MNYKSIISVILISYTSGVLAQSSLNLYGDLKFGEYLVGFGQRSTIDTFQRKIGISLWYPASEKGEPLLYSDYLSYNGEYDRAEMLRDISVVIGGKEELFSQDTLELILNADMRVSNEPMMVEGKFPLIIWSTRYGTVEYQNILSEFLASHGYVVAFAEDSPNAPYPWQIQSSEEKIKVFDQQLSDINTAIQFLKTQENIDSGKIGMLSWSYGGESAIITQLGSKDIDLMVGLSSIGFKYGLYLGGSLPGKIKVEKLKVPYLILNEKIAPNGKLRTPPDLLDSMHSNSRYISFEDIAHGNFNVIEGMIPGVLNTNRVQSWSIGGRTAQKGYETICEIVLLFLNANFQAGDFSTFDVDISKQSENSKELRFSVNSPKKE